MKILIACEYSGTVRDAFTKKGHTAISCDILPTETPGPHYTGDIRNILYSDAWDLVIAHPPCTYLTYAGDVRMYPKKGIVDRARLAKAIQARDFFMLFYNAKCPRIAIENPLPMRIVNLPEKSQVVQPYEYGEPFSKKTYLWLKGLPALTPTKVLTKYRPFINKAGYKKNLANYKEKKFATSSKERSKTFQGIADAMAEQWTNAYYQPSML